MRSNPAFFALWLLIACALAPHASAQSAEDLIRQGIDARRQQHDERALDLFRQAYELDGRAEGLAQMALAEQALGRWVEAYRHLRAALDAPDPWVEGHRGPLQEAMAVIDARVARVSVECNVAGAQLSLDGVLVGTLPTSEPYAVMAGQVILDVTADGYLPRRQQETLPGGTLTRLSVRLVAVANAAPREGQLTLEANVDGAEVWINGERIGALPFDAPIELPLGVAVVEVRAEGYVAVRREVEIAAAAPTRLVLVLEGAGRHATDSPAPPPGEPGPLVIAGGITLGAGVLGLVGSLIAVAIREEHVLLWNDDVRCPESPSEGRLFMCADLYSTWRTAEDWAIALGVSGGLLSAGALVLVLIGLSEETSARDTTVSADVSPNGASVSLRQRF